MKAFRVAEVDVHDDCEDVEEDGECEVDDGGHWGTAVFCYGQDDDSDCRDKKTRNGSAHIVGRNHLWRKVVDHCIYGYLVRISADSQAEGEGEQQDEASLSLF